MNSKAIELWKIAKNTCEKCMYSIVVYLCTFTVSCHGKFAHKNLFFKMNDSQHKMASNLPSTCLDSDTTTQAMIPRQLYCFCHGDWCLLFVTQNHTGALWGSWHSLADSHVKSFICYCKFRSEHSWPRDDGLVLCVSIFATIRFIFLFIFPFPCYEHKCVLIKGDWRYTTLTPANVSSTSKSTATMWDAVPSRARNVI
jgi:hypothetical protein